MQVIMPRPYSYVSLAGVRAVTVDTGSSRGIVTVNHPVGIYGTSDGHATVRGQNHTGTSVRVHKSGRILSVVTKDGRTHVVPNLF